jgi:hypothetical protein
MSKLPILAALPLLAALGGCGGGNDIVTTNDNNVVLNDAQANYASTNDGEVPANATGGAMAGPDNATANDTMPAASNGAAPQ